MTVNDIFRKCKVYHDLKPIFKYMEIEYEDMLKEKSDRVNVISGYEGSGKSYFEMHLFDYWYTKILKKPINKYTAALFAHTNEQWAKGLHFIKDKPCYRLSHDEGVILIYSKDATTKKNKAINKGFKQIRGKQIYHSILIPQVHRIDKELREDRIRMLYFVFKHKDKRYVAVYPKMRFNIVMGELHRMIESVAKDVKGMPNVLNCEMKPSFVCEIPLYTGKLLNYYGEKKEDNMDKAISHIMDEVGVTHEKPNKGLDKDVRDKLIVQHHKEGLSYSKIGKKYGLDKSTVGKIIKSLTSIKQDVDVKSTQKERVSTYT